MEIKNARSACNTEISAILRNAVNTFEMASARNYVDNNRPAPNGARYAVKTGR
jgi:hypothetical protein